MADILLVNPLFLYEDPVESKLMTPYFPLGVLYVAAVSRQLGYDVAIFDSMFASGPEEFTKVLQQEQPRIVGFGVLATVRQSALRLASIAQKYGACVLMGGADPTARPEVYLQATNEGAFVVDVVVMGESEAILPDLLPLLMSHSTGHIGIEDIPGIAYRDETGAVVTQERCALIRDIDEIPFPARDLVDWEPYRKAWQAKHGYFSLSIIATRGCPFRCAWCQKIVFGRSFRPRDPESVAEEMHQIKKRYRPDFIRIVDDAMGIQKDWVRRWRDALLAKDAVIPFECLSRVDLVNEEMALWLKEAGCKRIAFGAESGSQKVLDAMTKGSQVAQIYKAAEVCRNVGIETYFYMMVGYPGETWTDLKSSVQMLRKTRPDMFSTTIAYPLPGTAFYEQVKSQLPVGANQMPDWDYTAENKLLFGRGAYSTYFYRRVIRWFQHEWEDAWIRAGKPASFLRKVKNKLALWRDRIIINILAQLPGLGSRATGFGND